MVSHTLMVETATLVDLGIGQSILEHSEKGVGTLAIKQLDRQVGSVIHQTSRLVGSSFSELQVSKEERVKAMPDEQIESLERKLVETQQRETQLNGHIVNYKKVVQSQNEDIARLQE